MKNILTLTAVSGLLMFAACSKQSNPSASMTASVNSVAFSTLGPGIVTTGGEKKITTIVGTNTTTPGSAAATSITLTVKATVNTYEINSSAGVSATLYSSATGGAILATSGTIMVTKATSSYFQGTFSLTFVGTSGTFTVTNGQFTGTY